MARINGGPSLGHQGSSTGEGEVRMLLKLHRHRLMAEMQIGHDEKVTHLPHVLFRPIPCVFLFENSSYYMSHLICGLSKGFREFYRREVFRPA